MKFLPRLYATIDPSYTPRRFNRLYQLHPDPFGTRDSAYERQKQIRVLDVIARRFHRFAIDVGCGSAVLTRQLLPYCERVLGIDYSLVAIRHATRKCRQVAAATFVVVDIRTFACAFPCDLLLCSEILYYLSPADLAQVCLQMRQWLHADGWLVVVGRVDDAYVLPSLSRQFRLCEQRDYSDERRPYRVACLTL